MTWLVHRFITNECDPGSFDQTVAMFSDIEAADAFIAEAPTARSIVDGYRYERQEIATPEWDSILQQMVEKTEQLRAHLSGLPAMSDKQVEAVADSLRSRPIAKHYGRNKWRRRVGAALALALAYRESD